MGNGKRRVEYNELVSRDGKQGKVIDNCRNWIDGCSKW